MVYEIIKNPEKPNALLIGDKTPYYIHEISFLLELFPNAKFIHLVRDGRDAFLSIKNLRWDPDNVLSAAIAWRNCIKAWEKMNLPSTQGIVVKYEDLLENTMEVTYIQL